jgi:serine-type D-Ala-D-Ala carboxypeptidase (penicillin-binding protein 5/6)
LKTACDRRRGDVRAARVQGLDGPWGAGSKGWTRTACAAIGLALSASAGLAGLDERKADPYLGAIAVETSTGKVLFEDGADRVGYPASMIKLMTLFVTLDRAAGGEVSLDDPVRVSREAEAVGGRQVWLAAGEVFALRELLYAMMVHSANDAAAAVAEHVGGGDRAVFVGWMNRKAVELGMNSTVFHNVHGLPPDHARDADCSTARDIARLARALLDAYPEALSYTSVRRRPFRPSKPMTLTSPNALLSTFPGCDGLKTGYFRLAGFSVAATAERGGARVIAVVLGCRSKETRNRVAAEILEAAFARLPRPVETVDGAPGVY